MLSSSFLVTKVDAFEEASLPYCKSIYMSCFPQSSYVYSRVLPNFITLTTAGVLSKSRSCSLVNALHCQIPFLFGPCFPEPSFSNTKTLIFFPRSKGRSHFTVREDSWKHVYEVPGMISLYPYLHTYSLLTGVTSQVLPLSSCALSQTMLWLLETFLEPLLWHSRHFFLDVFSILNSYPFNADFIFANSQKSYGAKLEEYGAWSNSVTHFWARNCLTESALWAGAFHGGESNCWAKVLAFFYAQLQVTVMVFQQNKFVRLSGLVKLI